MQHSPSRPPPRDPLGETWPDDPHGLGMTDRQIDYVSRMLEAIEQRLPTETELEYLRQRHEEERRWRAVKDFLRLHWPRTAMVLGVVGVAIGALIKALAWLAAYNVTITHK